MHHDHSDNKFFFGFFLGGIIGALTIFFLGTKEGKRAGKMLVQKGEEALDELEEKVGELEEKGKELIKRGEEIKEDVLDTWEEKKDDVSKEATKRIDQALNKLEDVQRASLSATSTFHRHFINLPKKK